MDTKLGKNVQTYIELMYSEKSDLNHIQDIEERKQTACEKAKLDYKDQITQDIIHLKNEDANTAIFDYLRSKNSNKYIKLISDQHLFWEMQQKLMKPLKDVDDDSSLKEVNLKNTISEKSDALLERINRLYLEIYRDEQTVEMAINKVRMMRPEDRIKKKSA